MLEPKFYGMRRVLSQITALSLAFVVAFTAVAVGAVQGQADAEGRMVICTGHGPIVQHFDADGNPTGAPHLCPDCVVTLLAAAPPWHPEATPVATPLLALGALKVPVYNGARASLLQKARAPPRTV